MKYKRQLPLHANNFTIDNVFSMLFTNRQTQQTYGSYIDTLHAFSNPMIYFSQQAGGLVITEDNFSTLLLCDDWQLHYEIFFSHHNFLHIIFQSQNISQLLLFIRTNNRFSNNFNSADQYMQQFGNRINFLYSLCLLPIRLHFFLNNNSNFVNIHLSFLKNPITLNQQLINAFQLLRTNHPFATYSINRLLIRVYDLKNFTRENFFVLHDNPYLDTTALYSYYYSLPNLYPSRRKFRKDENGRYYLLIPKFIVRKNKTNKDQETTSAKIQGYRLYFEFDTRSRKHTQENFLNALEEWINLNQWLDNPDIIRNVVSVVIQFIYNLSNYADWLAENLLPFQNIPTYSIKPPPTLFIVSNSSILRNISPIYFDTLSIGPNDVIQIFYPTTLTVLTNFPTYQDRLKYFIYSRLVFKIYFYLDERQRMEFL